MKKQISKLTLKRETLKILLQRELGRARGGARIADPHEDCPTQVVSGCAGGLVADAPVE
jgi:hypothetical protein